MISFPRYLCILISLAGAVAKYCDDYVGVCVCVCVSVCLQGISGTTRAIFTKFVVHVAYGRGSVLLWRRCNKLCTSGFVASCFL